MKKLKLIFNSVYRFRYTLEDLVPMMKRLSERTNAFFEWKKSVTELYSIVKEVENSQGNGFTESKGSPNYAKQQKIGKYYKY
jgi:hypothetical protein